MTVEALLSRDARLPAFVPLFFEKKSSVTLPCSMIELPKLILVVGANCAEGRAPQ